MPYYEKRIRSGKVLEVMTYFATRDGRRIDRGLNERESDEEQAAKNDLEARMQLARILRCNFSREAGDLFVTLTFAGEVSETEAYREERNLYLRMERLRKKKGLEPLKRLAVVEKQGKWHIHLVVNGGLTLEEVQALWGNRGRVMMSLVDESEGFRDLANYLCREQKPKKGQTDGENQKQQRRKWQRRWHASRNLKKPEVVKKQVKRPPVGQPKKISGYRLLPEWSVRSDRFGNLNTYAQYMREEPKPQDKSRKAGKEPGAERRSVAVEKRERSDRKG